MGARLAYVELVSWAWGSAGECRPKQSVIAWHLGVSVRQVKRYVQELAAIGVIKVTDRTNEGKSNLIEFSGRLEGLTQPEKLNHRRKVYAPAMRKAGFRP